jgi:hypothetical protein
MAITLQPGLGEQHPGDLFDAQFISFPKKAADASTDK